MNADLLEFKKHRLVFVTYEMAYIREWLRKNKFRQNDYYFAKERLEKKEKYKLYKLERQKLIDELKEMK